MMDKIGEEFDGVISSVTNFGMFVELPNTIEGLVHVSFMTDDFYRFDEQHYAMIGERTGNIYRIGDEITVRVVDVNKDERNIDFEIVGMKGSRRRENRMPITRRRKRHLKKKAIGSHVRKRKSEEKTRFSKRTKAKKKEKEEISGMLQLKGGEL